VIKDLRSVLAEMVICQKNALNVEKLHYNTSIFWIYNIAKASTG